MVFAKTLRLILWLIFCGIYSCSTDDGEVSRKDDRRSAATPMELGGISDDKVDPETGDSTDWKRFNLIDADTVTVTVYFDESKADATVVLRDAFGTEIKRCVKEPNKDCSITIDLKRGDYFIGIQSNKMASVYTLTVELGSGNIAGTGGYDDPRPE